MFGRGGGKWGVGQEAAEKRQRGRNEGRWGLRELNAKKSQGCVHTRASTQRSESTHTHTQVGEPTTLLYKCGNKQHQVVVVAVKINVNLKNLKIEQVL